MPKVQKAATRVSKRGEKITDAEKQKFVELLRAGCTKNDAATMLERRLFSFNRIAKQDADFRLAVEEAWQDGAEALIQEAERRGRDGWDEPIYQKGELVGHVRKYSDNLLMFSIKGRRPEYKENPRIDISSVVGVKFEDRSAQVAEMWRVLADAGVDAKAIAAGLGGQPSRAELPVVAGVVAEPSDV